MPPRPAIDPQGTYHVGSRGTYGRTLFRTRGEHELFLELYARSAEKYGWHTLAWTLMKNHHHFVVELTRGGLSEGMRELHGGYARRIHAAYGQTRKGHLFRHAFFARHLVDDEAVIGACAYVDLNPSQNRLRAAPRRGDWCSYAATWGSTNADRSTNPRGSSACWEATSPDRAPRTASSRTRSTRSAPRNRRQTTVYKPQRD